MMSRLATLAIVAMLGVYMANGPPAAMNQRAGDWTAPSSSAAIGTLAEAPFACAVLPLAMGPDPGGKSGTQALPDSPQTGRSNGLVKTSGHPAAARNLEEAEYKAQLCECDALEGRARYHCIEYVKLRTGRS